MNKLKAKLQGGKKERAKSHAGTPSDASMMDGFRKFYGGFEKHLAAMMHSGSRLRAIGGVKSKKESTQKYEENVFVEFMNKYGSSLTKTHRDALDCMTTCYNDVAALKYRRDCTLKADVYDPINNSTMKQLEHITKLRKELASAESAYSSAQKSVDKSGEQAAMLKRDQAASQRDRAQSSLDQATKEFKADESSRLAVLCAAAQAQQEFYKSALDAFSKLTVDLNNIRTNATDNYSTSPTFNSGPAFAAGGGLPQSYVSPGSERRSNMPPETTNGSINQSGSRCRALYDFNAEQEDDLSLKKDDIATIIEKVDDDWYYGEKDGRRGHFPIGFVELID